MFDFSYANFRLLYTADEQTFRATTLWCCLSAKPMFQSLHGLSNVRSSNSVHLFLQEILANITPCPLVLIAVVRCVPSTYIPTHAPTFSHA